MINNLPMPNQLTHEEIMDVLLREEYGIIPPAPKSVSVVEESCFDGFCAGKAPLKKLILTCELGNGEFSFPIYFMLPKSDKPLPCFIHINFRNDVPDRYLPSEEIADTNYAVISCCYQDISSDDGDFTNGLAGIIYPGGKRTSDQCGKIGLWAWAASRIMDYAITVSELDKNFISVAGHSRLGKTALLTGALDHRFFCAFSNDSGCGGAALARVTKGEKIKDIYKKFPYWFCENYEKYIDNEDSLPFDQHYLLSANFPHKVYVASAAEDWWADPNAEYLACVAASSYYEERGLAGFVHPDRLPEAGDFFGEGNIGYHLRTGCHYLSRTDWLHYIRFLNSFITKEK